jgi:hypothetical protein
MSALNRLSAQNRTRQAWFLLDLSQVTTNELAPIAGSAFTSFLSLCCHR